ncbi:MAG: zf-HC2 domain-containing protein, partial [Planctomycetia bacterium]|nr:zf-HC2 domain-containing protein [Planctomycetia bacterium]
MNCDEIKPLLAGYVDDQLSTVQSAAVEGHVESCGRCRESLQSQRSVQRILIQNEGTPLTERQFQLVSARLEEALSRDGETSVEEDVASLLALVDEPKPPPKKPPAPGGQLPPMVKLPSKPMMRAMRHL